MTVVSLDHVVLTVTSLEETLRFYRDVLGMTHRTFGGGRHSLHFGDQKLNIHIAGHEFEPKAASPAPGAGDLCFLVRNLDDVIGRLDVAAIHILEGPVEKTGAISRLMSVYVRDPDGNLIELSEPIT